MERDFNLALKKLFKNKLFCDTFYMSYNIMI
jgi:hypothetical protein